MPHTRRWTGIGFGAAALLMPVEAVAQNANPNFGSSYYNQTYQHGLALPHVPLPSGSDEFRAADGTSCRSNTASNDAYLDVGAIGSQDIDGSSIGGTFYGRIIMPLGPKPKRLDCTHLYTLEIERLRHELQLVRMGAGGRHAPTSDVAAEIPPVALSKTAAKTSSRSSAWQTDGWSTPGRTPPKAPTAGATGAASGADQDRPTVVPARGASRLGGPEGSLRRAAASPERDPRPSLDVGSGWVTIVERAR